MKRIHRMIVCSLLVALVSAWSVSFAAPVRMTFWNGIGPPEAEILSSFVKEFNEKYNGQYFVEETLMKWDTLYSKLLIDYRAGNPPNVLTFHQPAMKQYVSLGVLQDINKTAVARAGFREQDYVATAWKGSTISGKRYAIPIDMHPWALYYNRTLFKAAGLPDRAPQNMEEFLNFAQKLTVDANKDGKIDQWGFGYQYNGAVPHRFLITLLAQKKKSLLTKNLKQAAFNNSDTKEALQFLHDLVYKYKVTPERETDPSGDFMRGSVAMILDGPWNLGDFKAAKNLDFMTAPVPKFYERQAVWGSSHVMVMARNKNRGVNDTALKFMAFVNSKGYEWTSKAGHMPIRKDILNGTKFKELKEWQAFADSLAFMVYYPSIDQYSQVFTSDPASPLVKMTESVLLGKESVDKAVKIGADSLNQLLSDE